MTRMNDPLEDLVIDMSPIMTENLGKLLESCSPWPWDVVEDGDSIYVIVKGSGDALARLPNDQHGKKHARLMAAAPLLAQRLWEATNRGTR